MRGKRLPLQDLLLRDWGTELPIRGGYGQSREDPIVITTPDTERTALTQALVLRGLGKGRGVFWRTIARAPLGDQWPGIEQLKIETIELTDTQIVTQTENYYFDVSSVIAAHQKWLAPPIIVHHHVSGLAFPFEIGWLHFDNSENNEPDTPGLGITLHYKAPGIICSLYVYDRGRPYIPHDVTDDIIRAEFERAASEIATARVDFAECPTQATSQRDYFAKFYRVGDDGRKASLLLLTTSRGQFVKARMTWFCEPFIDDAAKNFVDILLATIRSSGQLPTVAP